MLFMQVTVTGVKVEAVKTLLEVIYRGISNLEQVLLFSLIEIFYNDWEWQPTGVLRRCEDGVATQLGFKGMDGLVMEQRTTIQLEDVSDGPGGPARGCYSVHFSLKS